MAKEVLNKVDGYKVYIGLGVGALALIAHALGVEIPGVQVDDNAIVTNLWQLFMVGAGRSALAKLGW